MASTVFLVQSPPPYYPAGKPPVYKDLSSAVQYGRLVNLLEDGVWASLDPKKAAREIEAGLIRFNSDIDYVCFAGGDPVALAMTLLTLRNGGFETVRYLTWERERDTDGARTGRGYYRPVVIRLQPEQEKK